MSLLCAGLAHDLVVRLHRNAVLPAMREPNFADEVLVDVMKCMIMPPPLSKAGSWDVDGQDQDHDHGRDQASQDGLGYDTRLQVSKQRYDSESASASTTSTGQNAQAEVKRPEP